MDRIAKPQAGGSVAPALEVLYEDNHCLAVFKPSGIASAHFQGEQATLDLLAKQYLKAKYHKPGNVFLGVVHRLDRPVSDAGTHERPRTSASQVRRRPPGAGR